MDGVSGSCGLKIIGPCWPALSLCWAFASFVLLAFLASYVHVGLFALEAVLLCDGVTYLARYPGLSLPCFVWHGSWGETWSDEIGPEAHGSEW
jgi:hypothetical protein